MEKAYTKPDLNAPRYKIKRMNLLTSKFCDTFHEKFPKYNKIDNELIKKIIITTNENIAEHVTKNRDGAEMPEGLGYLFIGSCPAAVKKNNINKMLSEIHNRQIKHHNLGSDSFVAKIFYTNYANRYKFKMRELWMFKGSREFSRATSKEYVKNWEIYTQVDNFVQIRKLYNKHLNKARAIRLQAEPTEDYNEFDLN